MGFENILKNDIKKDELNKSEYRQIFKERVHMSKGKMDLHSSAAYLKIGQSMIVHYNEETSARYIAAIGMTYDAMLTIFDVNSRSAFAYRFFKYNSSIKEQAGRFVAALAKGRPNLEARLMGFQNNQDFHFILNELADFFINHKIALNEVDIFGSLTRHIAIDAKLGQSYNILVEDRLYRPGELSNALTMENFEAAMKDAETADAAAAAIPKPAVQPKAPPKK